MDSDKHLQLQFVNPSYVDEDTAIVSHLYILHTVRVSFSIIEISVLNIQLKYGIESRVRRKHHVRISAHTGMYKILGVYTIVC